MAVVKTVKTMTKCSGCAYCEQHQIWTDDSFEHEHGLYCSLKEDKCDSWERRTYDGDVNKRLIGADDWDTSDISIPDWCPLSIKNFQELAGAIVEAARWKEMIGKIDANWAGSQKLIFDHGEGHIKRVVDYAKEFLKDLDKYVFENFYIMRNSGSVEHNIALVALAAILHDIGLSGDVTEGHAAFSAKLAKDEFLWNTLIDEEDKNILLKAISNHSDGSALVEEAQKTLGIGPEGKAALGSDLAVPVALFLADKLDATKERLKSQYVNSIGEDKAFDAFCEAISRISKVEFRLVDPGRDARNGWRLPVKKAELHYTVDDGFEFKALKYFPGCILVPKMVAKDILGIRQFAVYVNGTRKDISKF